MVELFEPAYEGVPDADIVLVSPDAEGLVAAAAAIKMMELGHVVSVTGLNRSSLVGLPHHPSSQFGQLAQEIGLLVTSQAEVLTQCF